MTASIGASIDLSAEAQSYVAQFEARLLQKGATIETLMASAIAMQNKASEVGNDEQAAALADAITFIEQKHGVDSVVTAGKVATSAIGNDDGHGVFVKRAGHSISCRATQRAKDQARLSEGQAYMEAITKKVAELYNLPFEDIIGQRLGGKRGEANRLAVYISRNVTDLSWSEIGLYFSRSGNAQSQASNTIAKYNNVEKHMNEPDMQEKLEHVMTELGLEVKTKERAPMFR